MTTKFDQIYPWSKLILFVGSFVCISVGWIKGLLPLALAGAILYLLGLTFGYVSLVIASKRFRRLDLPIEQEPASVLSVINKILEGVICFSGLISFLVDNSLFSITGAIIWIGTIAIYALCGVTINVVTGIPLKMGYGGWYIPKSRRKNR